MESYFVLPLTLDKEDDDQLNRNDDLEEINMKTREAIDTLRNDIFTFKKMVYGDVVSGDKKHSAGDMGAMMSFHAIFLQVIGYWIGLLDSAPVPPPIFKNNSEIKEFRQLTKTIQKLAETSQDARTLVYSLLFSFSTQHPFELGAPQENEDDE